MEYLHVAWRSRHFCVRELLKIVVPGRWQSAQILENICHEFGHKRLSLPECAVEVLFPEIEQISVKISHFPHGNWSTPVTDQLMLAKFARIFRPKNVLEVGSFRGYTARVLAENTAEDCTIHTLDISPDHGSAYLDTSLASRIKRYVGSLHSVPSVLPTGMQFDFIFLDADHRRESVESDTRVILPLLSAGGVIFWHDYADWGWMSEWNGVPEFLSDFQKELPILSIPGTSLAVYQSGWSEEHVMRAIDFWNRESNRSHWQTSLIRGEDRCVASGR